MATEKRLMGYDPITFESFTRHMTKHREPYDQYDMGYVDAVDNIEDWLTANAVEVVEVVHGRWIGGYRGTEYTIPKCSQCGYGNGAVGASNYCPNCGAKMDGDGNEID